MPVLRSELDDRADSRRLFPSLSFPVDEPWVIKALQILFSRESVYSRDCCHSQLWRLGFQEKTSNWEGDPPGELTVPQTDTGEQVEYTRALERTMSKELGKMTP